MLQAHWLHVSHGSCLLVSCSASFQSCMFDWLLLAQSIPAVTLVGGQTFAQAIEAFLFEFRPSPRQEETE